MITYNITGTYLDYQGDVFKDGVLLGSWSYDKRQRQYIFYYKEGRKKIYRKNADAIIMELNKQEK